MKAFTSLVQALAAMGQPMSRAFRSEPKWYGRPKDEKLVVPKCDPSQHNTLRHDQVERKRKQKRRAGRKPNKPYRKIYA